MTGINCKISSYHVIANGVKQSHKMKCGFFNMRLPRCTRNDKVHAPMMPHHFILQSFPVTLQQNRL